MNDTPHAIDPSEALSRAVLDLLLREPFYGHVLQSIARSFSPEVETAAVRLSDDMIELIFHPGYLTHTLDHETRVAVLKHEVLHLVFRHLYRAAAYAAHPLLYNVAADLVVNQYIGSWQLPDGAITRASFPNIYLKPEESLDYYYHMLLQQADQIDMTQFTAPHFAGHRDWGGYTEKANGTFSTVGAFRLDKLLWDAYQKGTTHGKLPGSIVDQLQLVGRRLRSRLNWKQILRLFSQQSASFAIEHTTKRYSKRFGTRPGVRIRKQNRLLVAVDTSGSISSHELSIFFQEIDEIWRQGALVTVVECDAKVQAHYRYHGKPPANINGRGGTAFDPIFSFINQSVVRYDGCIYLSDGEAQKPKIRPRCRLLWVITANGTTLNTDFGRTVVLSEK